eukprot:6709522-Alexandrium_andersonii.AAC.1
MSSPSFSAVANEPAGPHRSGAGVRPTFRRTSTTRSLWSAVYDQSPLPLSLSGPGRAAAPDKWQTGWS